MDRKRKRAQQNYAALANRDQQHVPDVYGIRKRATARLHRQLLEDQDNDYDDEDALAAVVMSDTEAAAQYLIATAIGPQHRMSAVAKRIPPMCAIHQIYSMLPGDNTTIDREMRALVDEGSWRKFHVAGTLENELVVMKTKDYLASIDSAKEEYARDEENNHVISPDVFDRFKCIVQDPKHRDLSITRGSLKDFTDLEITRLVNSNLILPHTRIPDTYWFAIRNNGTFMSYYRKGRVNILRTIQKRPTKDILEKLLKEKKLNSTLFSHEFILHDLVGSGRVERHKTPMGNLIRLTKKGERCQS